MYDVGDRAWWVIESVFLHSSDKGFWVCLEYLPPDMPRWPETWVSLCNLMLKIRGISHSSAILASLQSNNRKGNSYSYYSLERPYVIKHAISGYLRLPRPTPVPALMREMHWHRR